MLSRRQLIGVSLATLCAGEARAREPAGLVLAIPANRSPALNKLIGQHMARLYGDIIAGDRLIVVNASTQGVVAHIVAGDLGDADNEVDRDEALLDQFAPVSRFIAVNDSSVSVDNCNIPATLRAMKSNLPWFPDRKANVIIFGSLNWENRKDATWAFKDHLVMDGFLNERGGPFGVVSEENILNGALVSILFTDAPDAFITSGGEKWVQNFWGKSIKGRGGRVGAIEPYNAGSYPRLFATLEDITIYSIDPNAPKAIIEPRMVLTPTYRSDQPIPTGVAKPRPVRTSPGVKPPSVRVRPARQGEADGS
jgi:hypothetical protein